MKNALIILLVVLLAASFAFSAEPEPDGKALFEAKCSRCHALDRSLKKTKTLPEWKKTTAKMAKYAKGAITEKEAEQIAEYLAGRNEK
ncbi:MAG: cytochrome c [Desulfobacterales bacterium]|uniref:Cytochrome c n=1 Tax=Candidatus Desulfatibia profunda TaxID=2841695 RepID=A0A8J6NQ33_9BACT|nr:cytochrome c [Candidatus Desulfatibia profunda]MBL7180458.1 cytochrome c [Desulfobacterales bacterium]